MSLFIFDLSPARAETEPLYAGDQAPGALGLAARDEIFTIFPELDEHIAPVAGARIFAPGRKARNLARRHGQAKKALVM